MTSKSELHDLIENLDERGAIELLLRLRQIERNGRDQPRTPVPMSQRGQPHIIAGRDLGMIKRKSAAEIAAEQGVSPIKNIDDLRGNFWPDDEDPDDFVNAVREWRREGGCG